MAACLARLIGKGKNSEVTCERPGTESVEVQANTFKTFTTCVVNADGSGSVQIAREIDGRRIIIHRVEFGAEEDKGALLTNILPWGSGAEVARA